MDSLTVNSVMQDVNILDAAVKRSRLSRSVSAISGIKALSSRLPMETAVVNAESLLMTFTAAWITASGMTGLTLSGMIEEPDFEEPPMLSEKGPHLLNGRPNQFESGLRVPTDINNTESPIDAPKTTPKATPKQLDGELDFGDFLKRVN